MLATADIKRIERSAILGTIKCVFFSTQGVLNAADLQLIERLRAGAGEAVEIGGGE